MTMMCRRAPYRIALGCASAVVLVLLGSPGSARADFTITEGQPFSGKVVDIGGCSLSSASITWGDGSPASTGASDGVGGVTGSHTYTQARTANGNVAYTCLNPSGSHSASFQVTVTDAALTAAGRNIAGTAGRSLTSVVAHVDDANPFGVAGDFSATIAWGDGFTSQASVTSAASGGFEVTSTHTYANPGIYPVSTTVFDLGGSNTTTGSTAQIVAAPPPIPRNLSSPVASGEPRDGEPLSTTNGNWGDAPTGYEYQWLRCATATGGNCLVVAGATARTYTAVKADVGSTMRARVRAENGAGTSLPADSAPTGVVQPLILRARFTVSPNPTCTGLPVTFDASISKTPEPPITNYRFTETTTPDFFPHYIPKGPYLLADGASPRATTVFGYDLEVHTQVPDIPAGVYAANPRRITLTVTDGTGATASYSQTVDFAQPLSTGSRTACPERHARVKAGRLPVHSVKFVVKRTSLTARLPCTTGVDCSGSLQLLQPGHTVRAKRARSARRTKPVLLGTSGFFFVPGRHSRSIAVKLTRAGRTLIRRGKPLTATLRLTAVGPTGHRTTSSRTVTLIKKKTRKKRR